MLLNILVSVLLFAFSTLNPPNPPSSEPKPERPIEAMQAEVTLPTVEPTARPRTLTPPSSSPVPQSNAQATTELSIPNAGYGSFNKSQTQKDLGNPVDSFAPRSGADFGYMLKISDPAKYANVDVIWASVKNEGTEPAFNVSYEAYYDGTLLNTVVKDRIDQTTTHTMKIAELPRHALGQHKIVVKVNSAKKIPERDYSNNDFWFTYTVLDESTRIAPNGSVLQ